MIELLTRSTALEISQSPGCDFLPGDLRVFPSPPSEDPICLAVARLRGRAKNPPSDPDAEGREAERKREREILQGIIKAQGGRLRGSQKRRRAPERLSGILGGGRKGGSGRSIARPSPLCPNNVTNNLIRLSQTPLWGVVQRSSENAPSVFFPPLPLIFLPLPFILPLSTFFSIYLFFFVSPFLYLCIWRW